MFVVCVRVCVRALTCIWARQSAHFLTPPHSRVPRVLWATPALCLHLQGAAWDRLHCHTAHTRTNSRISTCSIRGLVNSFGKKKNNQTKRQPWTGLSYFFAYFVICKFVQTYKWFYSPDKWFLRLPLGPETVFGILNCNVSLKLESTLLHRSACKFVEPQIFEAASIIFILYF